MQLEENISLAAYTSMHVGGPARYFARAKSDADVAEALALAARANLPFFVLGKGSNTIFPNAGYPGVVIHMEDRTTSHHGQQLTAASGTFMRQLVNTALAHGLRGLEELAGIPGTVGGAVRGNAGTWQTETKDVLDHVEILRPAGTAWIMATLTAAECQFRYRHSIFKEQPDWIILRATFKLQPGDAAVGQEIVARDLRDRHAKQPYDAPSAGSIFKNPDKEHGIFSGKLIEAAGLKGTKIGDVAVSPQHANFILNRGRASGDDVIALIRHIQKTVQTQQGITLEPEVVIVRPR